jgi:hypothetical protein
MFATNVTTKRGPSLSTRLGFRLLPQSLTGGQKLLVNTVPPLEFHEDLAMEDMILELKWQHVSIGK